MLQLSNIRADGIWARFGITRCLHLPPSPPAALPSELKLSVWVLVTKKPRPLFFLFALGFWIFIWPYWLSFVSYYMWFKLLFSIRSVKQQLLCPKALIFSVHFLPNQNLDVLQREIGGIPHNMLFLSLCIAGYQLTSAECFDLRSNRVVADQYCHYYPENIKPKPKLQECNLDPCPARSVRSNFKRDWALKE